MYYCPTCERNDTVAKLVFVEGAVTCQNHPPGEVDILWRPNDPLPAQEPEPVERVTKRYAKR